MDENVKVETEEQNTPACPGCGKPLGRVLVAQLKEEHRISYSITPKPGELINTRTLGDTCTHFGKLLEAIGKELGAKTTVLVERIETDDKGEHTIHCLIARVLNPAAQKKQSRKPPA
jgi:hypothetical protein